MNWRLAMAALLVAVTVRAETDPTAVLADFTNVTAGQYQVLVQGDRVLGAQVNWFMNQMLQQYSRYFANWTQKAPARVIVFSNAVDFRQYAADAAHTTHNGLAGYCQLTTDSGGNTFYELVTYQQEDLWRVLAHEGFHQFVSYELRIPPPTWLNEGLAQYFETSAVVRGRLSTGQVRKATLAIAQDLIRSRQAPPITDLIALDRAAFYENAAATYPTAWALAYYLLQRDATNYHDSAVRRYLSDLKLGKDPMASFATRFGRDPRQLQDDFEQYLLHLTAPPE